MIPSFKSISFHPFASVSSLFFSFSHLSDTVDFKSGIISVHSFTRDTHYQTIDLPIAQKVGILSKCSRIFTSLHILCFSSILILKVSLGMLKLVLVDNSGWPSVILSGLSDSFIKDSSSTNSLLHLSLPFLSH